MIKFLSFSAPGTRIADVLSDYLYLNNLTRGLDVEYTGKRNH